MLHGFDCITITEKASLNHDLTTQNPSLKTKILTEEPLPFRPHLPTGDPRTQTDADWARDDHDSILSTTSPRSLYDFNHSQRFSTSLDDSSASPSTHHHDPDSPPKTTRTYLDSLDSLPRLTTHPPIEPQRSTCTHPDSPPRSMTQPQDSQRSIWTPLGSSPRLTTHLAIDPPRLFTKTHDPPLIPHEPPRQHGLTPTHHQDSRLTCTTPLQRLTMTTLDSPSH